MLASQITRRVSYPGTAAKGTTVIDEEPTSDAAREIFARADEVK